MKVIENKITKDHGRIEWMTGRTTRQVTEVTYATINVENSGAAKSLRNENIGGGILLTTFFSKFALRLNFVAVHDRVVANTSHLPSHHFLPSIVPFFLFPKIS